MATFATPLEQWQYARDNLRQAILLHTQADAALKAYQQNPSAPWEPIAFHANDTGNPHGTTAEDVGLGLVENLPIASLTDIGDDVSTDAYMTPASMQALVSHQLKNQTVTSAPLVTVTPGSTTVDIDLASGNYQSVSLVTVKPFTITPLPGYVYTQCFLKVIKSEGAMPFTSTDPTKTIAEEGDDLFLAGTYLITITQVGPVLHLIKKHLPA